MTKIIAILQLTVPTVLLIAPFLYRRKFRPLVRFCISMALREKVRKAYMLALALVVILFSYSFVALEGASYWQSPTLLLGFVLLRYKLTDAMLHWIHEDRVILGIALGMVMFSMVVPQLYSLSASMALVMTAAMFYPSRAIIEMAKVDRFRLEYSMSDEDIIDLYF
jgi:hypothetical protein